MPDLDGRLSALRDELRATVPVPDVATVAERFQQRRVRRRMQIGAVAAVLVVSAAVPLLRQLDADPPPATPPPAPTTSATDPENFPFLYQMGFADEEHGYALRAQCAEQTAEGETPCELFLFGTEDGENWARIGDIPDRPRLAGGLGQLSVLGKDRLALDWFVAGVPNASDTLRLYSDDGGRTWEPVPVPDEPVEEVTEIPDGGVLLPACVGGRGGERCTEPGVGVLRPDTGTSARLANQPDLEDVIVGEIPTNDGYWWVAGRRPGTGAWALAVSSNDGRTWETTELDWPGTPNEWSVVDQRGTLYASAARIMGEKEDGLLAVFRSDDQGKTWQLVWQPTAAMSIPGFDGTLVAATDGSLTANQYGPHHQPYTSTDGGRTFVESDQRRFGVVEWTRAGYLAVAETTYEISVNGAHWVQFDIPVG